MASEDNKTEVTNETAAGGKKLFITEARLEICIAILLGITAFLMAWASWISSLHGGNQATNYTKSNNLAAEGNADWNEASQVMMQDMLVWNTIVDYSFDSEIARSKGLNEEADAIDQKMQKLMTDNCSPQMLDARAWASGQSTLENPFNKEGFRESYFTEAQEKLAESQALLEQGMADNANGDKYGLVSVFYSLVLFLLGIVGIFKRIPNRLILVVISLVFLVIASIYMATIPLPTDFALANYFKA